MTNITNWEQKHQGQIGYKYAFIIIQYTIMYYLIREKKKEIWLIPGTKAPTPTEKSSKQHRDNTKMPQKTSITQRLRTDLGRSVGVTTTQLVRLKRFTGSQPSH